MDKYDEQIAYLTEHPEKIYDSWGSCDGLFEYASTDRSVRRRPDGKVCGCLTMIRMIDHYHAYTDDLTERIRADERIPDDPDRITVAHLPVFAEWQRILDKELKRA